jgi:hypothetical protein
MGGRGSRSRRKREMLARRSATKETDRPKSDIGQAIEGKSMPETEGIYEHSCSTTAPILHQDGEPAINQEARPGNEQQTEGTNDNTPFQVAVPDPMNNKGDNKPKESQEDTNTTQTKPDASQPSKIGCVRKWKIAGGILMLILTAVMAGANVIYAIFGYYQLSAMNEQLTHMREASDLEYRPWIGYRNAILKELKAGDKIDCALWFVNTGKTPAFRVKWDLVIRVDVPNANIYELLGVDPRVDISAHMDSRFPDVKITTAPNAVMRCPADCKFQVSDQLLEDIRTKKKVLYMIGVIVYFDMHAVRHTTYTCHTINHDGKDITEYDQFNDMD